MFFIILSGRTFFSILLYYQRIKDPMWYRGGGGNGGNGEDGGNGGKGEDGEIGEILGIFGIVALSARHLSLITHYSLLVTHYFLPGVAKRRRVSLVTICFSLTFPRGISRKKKYIAVQFSNDGGKNST